MKSSYQIANLQQRSPCSFKKAPVRTGPCQSEMKIENMAQVTCSIDACSSNRPRRDRTSVETGTAMCLLRVQYTVGSCIRLCCLQPRFALADWSWRPAAHTPACSFCPPLVILLHIARSGLCWSSVTPREVFLLPTSVLHERLKFQTSILPLVSVFLP